MFGDGSHSDITWCSVTRVLYQTRCESKFCLEIMNLTQSLLDLLSRSLYGGSFTQRFGALQKTGEYRYEFEQKSGQNPVKARYIINKLPFCRHRW